MKRLLQEIAAPLPGGRLRTSPKGVPAGRTVCICPECDYRMKHAAGHPCRMINCPKCGARMVGGGIGEMVAEMRELLLEAPKPKPTHHPNVFYTKTEWKGDTLKIWYKVKGVPKVQIVRLLNAKGVRPNVAAKGDVAYSIYDAAAGKGSDLKRVSESPGSVVWEMPVR